MIIARTLTLTMLISLGFIGCNKSDSGAAGTEQQPAQAAPAPQKAAATPAEEPAKAAGAEAAGAGQGAPANPMQALANLAKAGEALSKGMGQKGMGPVVNWRALTKFVPDSVGDFKAKGDVDGSTGGMGTMQVSKVKRRYVGGEQKLRLTITDTSLVPMLRAGFAMAAQVNEDSSRGVKKGTTIEGQPGMLEWRKARKRGKLTLLVGGRFLVELRLRPTDDPAAVEGLAKKLDIKGLAALKPAAR